MAQSTHSVKMNQMDLFAMKTEVKIGTPGRTRTYNQLIKSQLLYQLSYRGDRGK